MLHGTAGGALAGTGSGGSARPGHGGAVSESCGHRGRCRAVIEGKGGFKGVDKQAGAKGRGMRCREQLLYKWLNLSPLLSTRSNQEKRAGLSRYPRQMRLRA